MIDQEAAKREAQIAAKFRAEHPLQYFYYRCSENRLVQWIASVMFIALVVHYKHWFDKSWYGVLYYPVLLIGGGFAAPIAIGFPLLWLFPSLNEKERPLPMEVNEVSKDVGKRNGTDFTSKLAAEISMSSQERESLTKLAAIVVKAYPKASREEIERYVLAAWREKRSSVATKNKPTDNARR